MNRCVVQLVWIGSGDVEAPRVRGAVSGQGSSRPRRTVDATVEGYDLVIADLARSDVTPNERWCVLRTVFWVIVDIGWARTKDDQSTVSDLESCRANDR